MRGSQLTIPVLVATAALIALSARAAHATPVPFRIESQPLDGAINEWARQSGYQVLIPGERDASQPVTPAVEGVYTPETALRVLLASSGLDYQVVNGRTVALRYAAASPTAATGTEVDSRRANGIEEVVVTATKRAENVQDVPVSIAVIGAQEIERRGLAGMEDYLRSVPEPRFSFSGLVVIPRITIVLSTLPRSIWLTPGTDRR